MKLLLVEDNVSLSKAVSTILKRNNYVVDCAFDGEEALSLINEYEYDLLILDIMIPKIDGLEVLARVRKQGLSTPIIMLTAKSTLEDKITGLDTGADDYLAKPFEVAELLARIRALTRRKENYSDEEFMTFGDLKLDLKSSYLYKGKEKVLLMNKEFQILKLLIDNKDKIISNDFIAAKAWDIDAYSTSDNVYVFVSYLRKKLEGLGSKVKIKSIRYKGYFLEY